jgi:hypothetical protein
MAKAPPATTTTTRSLTPAKLMTSDFFRQRFMFSTLRAPRLCTNGAAVSAASGVVVAALVAIVVVVVVVAVVAFLKLMTAKSDNQLPKHTA